MRIRFWGTRGSIAKPGPNTVRYGGNTSCVEVRADDTLIVLDCGTGAHELGLQIVAANPDRVIFPPTESTPPPTACQASWLYRQTFAPSAPPAPVAHGFGPPPPPELVETKPCFSHDWPSCSKRE